MCFMLGLGVLCWYHHPWLAPAGLGETGEQREPGGRARVLPTSGGAGSVGGSRYSSRAQPESLSDEAGGRPVAVPQGGGSSRWGHAGLGRDMSWGERIRAGEILIEAGSGDPSLGHVSSRLPSVDLSPRGSRTSSPSSRGGTPEHVQPGRCSAQPQHRDPWLNHCRSPRAFEGFSFLCRGYKQTRTEGKGAWPGWGFVC